MTSSVAALGLRPYVMGYGPHVAPMLARCPLPDARCVDIFDPAQQPFYQLVNAGNQLAFGGIGMPAWVQLDCATLPTAMIGFWAAREAIPEALWAALLAQVGRVFGAAAEAEAARWSGPVPLSEYCAIPSAAPETWVGYSLYTLAAQVEGLARAGLGIRTKALALACYGARFQIGMTQYHNRAVQTHAAFGSLPILEPRARPHTQPEQTFVYRLEVPPLERLRALIDRGQEGACPPEPLRGDDLCVEVAPAGVGAQVEALARQHGPLTLLSPGVREGAGGARQLWLRVQAP
jgi:hypothetical protein